MYCKYYPFWILQFYIQSPNNLSSLQCITSALILDLYQNAAFLLRNPVTFSLLLLPTSAQNRELEYHISNIQKKFYCKLTHSFTSYDEDNNHRKTFNQQIITPNSQGQLKPFLIGQLSVCYIKAAGYRPDYHLVVVNHIFPSQTKIKQHYRSKVKLKQHSTVTLQTNQSSSQTKILSFLKKKESLQILSLLEQSKKIHLRTKKSTISNQMRLKLRIKQMLNVKSSFCLITNHFSIDYIYFLRDARIVFLTFRDQIACFVSQKAQENFLMCFQSIDNKKFVHQIVAQML